MNAKHFIPAALSLAVLSACGSGGGGNNPSGLLYDAPIAGVSYSSGSVTGSTDKDGKFFYEAGKKVSFKLGDVVLGTVDGSLGTVTPFDLAGDSARTGNLASMNLLRFLQSIDADNNPDNGIEIPAAAAAALTGVSLDFSKKQEGKLTSLVKQIAGPERELRDEWSAWSHVKASLAKLGVKLPEASGKVSAKIIGFNDFHGALDIPQSTITAADPADASKTLRIPAGGVAYFASLMNQLKAKNPNHAVVSAGDMIGGTPLVSALFVDEPTIEAMNQIGIDFNGVGNHEFDKGYKEVLRMQYGGCEKNTPLATCAGNDNAFAGANFRMLAANVKYKDSGKTIFPAYGTKVFNGIPVAFIGMTLEGTPTIVTPAGISNLNFGKEPEAVNALVPQLKAQGIEAIVVIIHEGGVQTGLFNACTNLSGPITGILDKLDPAVDLIVSGHTHQAYNCNYESADKSRRFLLTSAAANGRLLSEIDIELDPKTRDIVSKKAANLIVASEGFGTTQTHAAFPVLSKDAGLAAHVQKYKALAAPLEQRTIGKINATITRTQNGAGESALGDAIADAQLAATKAANLGGAQIAFMNPGGIRADLTFNGDGTVTYGNLFTVQPFGNSLVVVSLTGAQLKALLEQQWTTGRGRILQVSEGFRYRYDATAPENAKVLSMTLNDQPIVPETKYRVTMNSFLATGGDGFTVFAAGTERLGGALDVDAFEDYFKAKSPLSPATLLNRIERVN
ncbi:MAG: bifunctional metallophosphatase/5'-nucleotidase [Gammaproteobacteria bacterium]|nr:bifunctional metallophosphatase/5'-nucleotidase [Gammaproteobacteria bacterium]